MFEAGEPIDVLLVEDDPGDKLVIREAFADNVIGNRLHVVRDSEQALDFVYRRGEYAGAPRPNLILLDLNLPKYDGRQVLETVKPDPALAGLPVVVLTASAAEEDIARSYPAARQCLRHHASRSRSVPRRDPTHRRVLRARGASAAPT